MTSKLYEIGCKLVFITNRKLHMGFQLVPKSVTLNGIIAHILYYFTELDRLGGRLYHSG